LFYLLSSFFFSWPNLSRRRFQCLPYFHTWCGLSAYLRCWSETCCTQLAENTGCKKSPKICHLRTIAQLCRAVSSQLRHVSTIGKNLLNSNISSRCPHNMANFGPLTAEIGLPVWGTPANFNGFCVLAALLYGTLVVCISQTLQRWTEGATYIRQGGHHVGHWPTFLVSSCFIWVTVALYLIKHVHLGFWFLQRKTETVLRFGQLQMWIVKQVCDMKL